ncbi:MAG: patatin-like phospholipase family protein, partial [Gammaproteobacteria bacterium]|nr:patatin-like phospholipase family protein [Gammaproteobacteria bacterium]
MDDSCHNLFSDQQVIDAEQARLRARRGLSDSEAVKDVVGLALSGGGVRSATFNLGLLQAMQRHQVLSQVDYLSTVSGGGYIGSSYTWLAAQSNGEFPFGTRREDHAKSGGRILDWIRLHGSYLTPGSGLDGFALMAAVLRGVFVNLVVVVPFFLLFMWTLLQFDLFGVILSVAGVLAAVLLAVWLIHALYSGQIFNNAFELRRKMDCYASVIARLIIAGIVLGSLPTMHQLAADWITTAFSTVGLTGLISMFFGWWSRNNNNERAGKSGWTLRIGLILLLYGILLGAYDFVWRYLYEDLYTVAFGLMELLAFGAVGNWALTLVSAALLLSVLIGLLGNINHVSMHRYYRDRLLEAYMMRPESPVTDNKKVDADRFYLRDIPQTSAPYHIINTNMNTIASADAKLRIRGGDNFIFSPLFCGSRVTGYAANADRVCNGKKINGYLGGTMDLATAFTISGAAVDPNTGVTRSRPLAFLMCLLNVRLGYWIR